MASIKTAWYWFVRNLVRVLFFGAGGGFRVYGADRVPREGAIIVAPVHVSTLDPPAVACGLPRMLAFMAKAELFEFPLFGSLIRSLGAFPVRRGEGDTEAIRLTLRLLGEGRAVLVFPEGTRGDGQRMLPVNRGVAMLAKRSGATVLPVGLAGTAKRLPRGASFPRFGRVTVFFGEPFRYSDLGGTGREQERAFGAELQSRLLDACRQAGFPVEPPLPETTDAGSVAASDGA
ncbi:MAG: lysophospholipid acyltransferase family protein [Fimbriimonadaceae bacterium]